MGRPLLPASAALSLAALVLATCSRDTTAPAGSTLSFSVVSGDGQQGTVGTTLAQPLVIQATDTRGKPAKNLPVAFLVTSGGGSTAPASATTDNQGLAQTTWTLGTSTAVAQRLEARAVSTNALLGAFTATALAGPATRMVLSAGDSQRTTRGTPVPIAPAVLLTDQYDNPVPGASVTFSTPDGGGSVTGTPATSGANGIAAVGRWTLGAAVGTNHLVAMGSPSSGLTPIIFTATATLEGGARMALHAGNNQTTRVNTAVPIPPSVRITDASGSPIQGVRPTFGFIQGGGSIGGITPASNADGVAAVGYWTLCCTRGTYILRATLADVVDTVYFTATGTAGAPATMAVQAGNSQSATTGTAVPIRPAVIVKDTFNNAVPRVDVTFVVTEGNGSVSGGNPATTDTNGIATVGSWTLGPTPGSNALAATVGGVNAAATFTATATPRPASSTRTTVTATPTAIIASTGTSATTVTVTARDASGLPIGGAAVVLTASGYGNTLTQPAGTTDANGVATGTLSSTGRGTKTVSATVGGVAITQTATVTVSAGPATTIAVLRGNNQTAGAGTPVFTPPAVIAGDAFNNSVPGVNVTFAVTAGGGSVSGTNPVITDAGGIAAIAGWTLGDQVGTNTLSATADGSAIAGNPVTFTATGVGEFWTRLAYLPTPRYFLAAGALNGTLYALGGSTPQGSGNLSTVEAYSPATNAWGPRTSMPTPRSSLAVGVVNDVLYAVGGWNPDPTGTTLTLATVEAYDPATDTWITKAPMPTPRAELAVAVANGILYAIGGAGEPTPCDSEPWRLCSHMLGTVEAYDPATDTWTARTSMPTPRIIFGAAAANGIVYAVGGQGSGNSWLQTLEAYDPATDTWTTRAPMPTGRFGLGVGVIDGILYAVGGEVFNAATTVNEAYNPVTDRWSTKVPMLEWRRFFGAAVLNGRFYAVGGSSSAASNWRLDLVDAYKP
jgi:adhesin/invasin